VAIPLTTGIVANSSRCGLCKPRNTTAVVMKSTYVITVQQCDYLQCCWSWTCTTISWTQSEWSL